MPKYINLDSFPEKIKSSFLGFIAFVLIVFLLGSASGFLIGKNRAKKTQLQKDPYIVFTLEIFDKVKANYWDKLSDDQLTGVYKLALEKITSQPQSFASSDKNGLEKQLLSVMKDMDNSKKKELIANLNDIVLANLNPFGRSRLYSKKEEVALQNTVNNVNPNVNQYEILGVDKTASEDKIKQAYLQKSKEWNPETNKSPEAKQKFEEINHAYEVLADQQNRQVYDVSGVEPTISWKIYEPDIFYMHLTKFSPTTLDDLQRTLAKSDNNSNLTSLILDLRDNIGGAIDGLPYFLGPFIGQDQYAYQFFHQGNREDFKTKAGWLNSLVKFKKVVVLVNQQTQSSAEVMAATLKKYNVGVLVGTKTKGWGTVEKVIPVANQIDPKETYSIFMVHSLTLRDDGQPIEAKGVEPVIDVSDLQWEKTLMNYFNYPLLVQTVKDLLSKKS